MYFHLIVSFVIDCHCASVSRCAVLCLQIFVFYVLEIHMLRCR